MLHELMKLNFEKGRAGDRFELPELGRSLTHFREGSPSIIIFRTSLTHLPVVLKSLVWFFTAKYQNWIILPSFFTNCFKILRLCGHTSVLFYTCATKRRNLDPSVETLQSTFLLLISNDPLFSPQSCHFWRLYSKINELSHSSHAAVLEPRKISTTARKPHYHFCNVGR